jgi:hypothetical protein
MKYAIPLILISLFLNSCASGGFCVRQGVARFSVPFDWPGPQDKELVSKEPVGRFQTCATEGVYVGMPKSELYEVFTVSQLEDYRKEGDREWITFSMQGEKAPAGAVTFYLVDGMVKECKGK